MAEPVNVEVWADVVCPWCYIGRVRLDRAIRRLDLADRVAVRHRAFELDPTPRPHRTGSTVDHLAAKYGTTQEQAQRMVERVAEIAAADGITLHADASNQGNTRDAHRLVAFAGTVGKGDATVRALFRAHFEQDIPVFGTDNLVAIATDVGLHPDASRSVLDGDDYVDAVEADELMARELGVTGVPFFVLDGRLAVAGAQPEEVLRQAVSRAVAER